MNGNFGAKASMHCVSQFSDSVRYWSFSIFTHLVLGPPRRSARLQEKHVPVGHGESSDHDPSWTRSHSPGMQGTIINSPGVQGESCTVTSGVSTRKSSEIWAIPETFGDPLEANEHMQKVMNGHQTRMLTLPSLCCHLNPISPRVPTRYR